MKRAMVGLLCAWLAFGAMPARAASTVGYKVILTDPKGDANGLDDQSQAQLKTAFSSGAGTATPAEYASLDILSVAGSWNVARKKATALTLTLTLAAPPDSDPVSLPYPVPHQYIIYFDTSRCAGNSIRWEFTPHNVGGVPDENAAATLWTHEKTFYPGTDCQGKFRDDGGYGMQFATIQGSSLVCSIPWINVALPKATKTIVSHIRVEARMRPRQAASYPVVDVAYDDGKQFVAGK